jgi:hypothetical protein
MPKKCADYPARVDLHVSEETRVKLIAIAYHQGYKGIYSRTVRELLDEGIKRYEEGLSKRDKEDFEMIMMNVKMAD